MKIYLTSVIVLFCSILSFGQTTVTWSDAITVADEEYSNRGPQITLNANNQPVVMWGRSFGNEKYLYISVLTDGGFTTPVNISSTVLPLISSTEGARIHSNGNMVFVVYQQNGNNNDGIYLVKSIDGGFSWWEQPSSVLDQTEMENILPSVFVDSDNNPWVSYLSSDNFNNTELLVRRSLDSGNSFEDAIVASEGADGQEICECCPPLIHVSDSKTYAFYRNNNDNIRDIWMSVMNNNSGFDEAYDCDDYDWEINACPASGPDALVTNSETFIAYMAAPNGAAQIYLSSVDGLDYNLNSNNPITGSLYSDVNQNFPSVAGNENALGVIWEQYENGNRDLIFTHSENGSIGIEQNSMNIGLESDEEQRYPSLAFDGEKFHLVYTDTDSGEVRYRVGSIVTIESLNENLSENFNYTLTIQTNILHLDLEQMSKGSIQVYNSSGKLIFKENLTQTMDVSTSSWSQGIYHVHLVSEKGEFMEKVLIGN